MMMISNENEFDVTVMPCHLADRKKAEYMSGVGIEYVTETLEHDSIMSLVVKPAGPRF